MVSSKHYSLLSVADVTFQNRYNLIHGIIKSIYLFQMFPWIAQAANNLPKFLIGRLLPQALVFDDFDRVCIFSKFPRLLG
jgi:hypothetical protein